MVTSLDRSAGAGEIVERIGVIQGGGALLAVMTPVQTPHVVMRDRGAGQTRYLLIPMRVPGADVKRVQVVGNARPVARAVHCHLVEEIVLAEGMVMAAEETAVARLGGQ